MAGWAGAQAKPAQKPPVPSKPAPAKPVAPKQAPAKPPAAPVQAQLPQTIGTNEIMKLTAPAGFVDDVIAYDNQRVAYVIADTATKAELHVTQLGCAKCVEEKKEIVVDLTPVTLRPVALWFVGQTRMFVVGATEDGAQLGALIDLGKTPAAPVYKIGPATHISVIKRDGTQRVVLHSAVPTKTGTSHHVEMFALDTGKRLLTSKPLELENDREKRIDLRVNHWTDSWTRVVGLKGGEWVKKENQRSPDTEATYDLIAGKYIENKPIADLFEQRKRFQVLADAGGQLDFVRMTPDNTAIQVWRQGQMKTIDLDQPLTQYDPKSLQGIVNPDGTAWLALKVDPVNADAVARQKADPEYLDVFKTTPDGKAVRRARILAKGVRHRFGVIGDLFWLLERSASFDRGGRALTIYSLAQ